MPGVPSPGVWAPGLSMGDFCAFASMGTAAESFPWVLRLFISWLSGSSVTSIFLLAAFSQLGIEGKESSCIGLLESNVANCGAS